MVSAETSAILKGLKNRHAALQHEFWAIAAEVAQGGALEILTKLVRLKADIESIDYAIKCAPEAEPEEWAKI